MSRRGFTVAELTVTLALGLLAMAGGVAVLCSTRAAEDRTWLKADAVDQAVRAQLWLERDLAALAAPRPPAAAEDGTELALTMATRAGAREAVTWRFDASKGALVRTRAAGQAMRFALGLGARVRFAVVDPGYARGLPPRAGEYGNRVAYRITAGASHPRGRQALTLVGAVSLAVKASRDTFPFWSRGEDAPALPSGGPS